MIRLYGLRHTSTVMHSNPEGVTYLPAGAVYVDGCDMLNTPPTYSETDNHRLNGLRHTSTVMHYNPEGVPLY
jgi:hypothetical protein